MRNVFESPESIKEKAKFRQSLNGYNKIDVQDFVNYVMNQFNMLYAVIKQHDIKLHGVDESKMQANFATPEVKAEEYINNFLTEDKSEEIKKELEAALAEISRLQGELDSVASGNQELSNIDTIKKGYEDTITTLNNELLSTKKSVEDIENSYKDEIQQLESMVEEAELKVNSLEKEKLELLNKKTTIEFSSDATESEKIAQLEKEILKVEREKQSLQMDLDKLSSVDIKAIEDKGNKLQELESKLNEQETELEKKAITIKTMADDLVKKEKDLDEKIAFVEKNKHLISEERIKNLEKKELEVEQIKKQMETMLSIARQTADQTKKEAEEEAKKHLETVMNETEKNIMEAKKQAEIDLEKSNAELAEIISKKSLTEQEIEELREKSLKEASDIIYNAEQEAAKSIEEAKITVEEMLVSAKKEAEVIVEQAAKEVENLEEEMFNTQQKIEDLKKYFLKVKNQCSLEAKRIYDRLEPIVYSDLDNLDVKMNESKYEDK